MKKSVPREGKDRVLMFTMDGHPVVLSGNIAVRFKTDVRKEDIENGVSLLEITKEDLEGENGHTWGAVRDELQHGIEAASAASVLIPVNRLREILSEVETAIVRIDLVPDIHKEKSNVTHLVNGHEYLQSKIQITQLDALRIVEVTDVETSQDAVKLGDSACIMGVMRARTEWFIDEERKEQCAKKQKEVVRNKVEQDTAELARRLKAAKRLKKLAVAKVRKWRKEQKRMNG